MNTDPNSRTRRKSADHSSMVRLSLPKKPSLSIQSHQVESKEAVVGDTPSILTKGSLTELDSHLPTWRDEEYDEGMAKREVNPKVTTFNEQVFL